MRWKMKRNVDMNKFVQLRDEGMSFKHLAERYGISSDTAWRWYQEETGRVPNGKKRKTKNTSSPAAGSAE